MNEQVFLHLLEVYGADIRRWPVEHQAAAAQYASSPAARHALLEGAALDRLLADCAPIIDDARTERLIRGMDARLLRHEGHLAAGACPAGSSDGESIDILSMPGYSSWDAWPIC